LAIAVFIALAQTVLPLPVVPKWSIWLVCYAVFVGIGLDGFGTPSFTAIDRLPTRTRVAIWIILVGAFILLCKGEVRFQWRGEKANALEGDLFLKTAMADRNLVEIGDGGGIVDNNSPGGDLFRIFADTGITVEKIGRHLLLSTEVHDTQGKLVVKLVQNHWSVNPEKSICLNKNYTADSLEVKDGRGHVVLQVRLFSDKIQIQGEWFDDRGRGIEMIGDRQKYKGGYTIGMPNPDQRWQIEQLIPPIFEYPSSQHWAEWK
jgi:hypothetical protein